jgi:hypothetical protein
MSMLTQRGTRATHSLPDVRHAAIRSLKKVRLSAASWRPDDVTLTNDAVGYPNGDRTLPLETRQQEQ